MLGAGWSRRAAVPPGAAALGPPPPPAPVAARLAPRRPALFTPGSLSFRVFCYHLAQTGGSPPGARDSSQLRGPR